MANRSKTNDRGGWRLPLRRERGMRQATHDRALGVRDDRGVAEFPTRGQQREQQGQGRSGERQSE